jgi:nucleoside 2-deoxyribosyltransferase
MIAYLAGPIWRTTDAECRDWREDARDLLAGYGIGVRDPMRRDYRGREDECAEEIVRGDLADILHSDIVIAMCLRPSWGTAMEIRHAYTLSRPVYAVVDLAAASPWLRFHAHLCSSLAVACRQASTYRRLP